MRWPVRLAGRRAGASINFSRSPSVVMLALALACIGSLGLRWRQARHVRDRLRTKQIRWLAMVGAFFGVFALIGWTFEFYKGPHAN